MVECYYESPAAAFFPRNTGFRRYFVVSYWALSSIFLSASASESSKKNFGKEFDFLKS